MNNITLSTNSPIAHLSKDHLAPLGTKNDNSVNQRFNNSLQRIKPSPISILDLGCAGGGMVKSFLDQGDIAVGVEGSDYSLIQQRAEWATIPDFLFTADITQPFQISNNKEQMKFDVITAWEFLEHINKLNLDTVFDNIDNHLSGDGIIIASINMGNYYHHETVETKQWWLHFIEEDTVFTNNFALLDNFAQNDFVRNLTDSFHVVLERNILKN